MKQAMARGARITSCLLALATVTACGGRTAPAPLPEVDAGDAGAPPSDMGEPRFAVDCGREVQFTAPGQPIVLRATLTSPAPIEAAGWEVLSFPPGLEPTLSVGPDASVARLTPPAEGSYGVEFTATDRRGQVRSCAVTVESVSGPPVAICPEAELTTMVDTRIEIEGDAFDDIAVVAYRWTAESVPSGLPPRLDGTDGPVLGVTAAEVGRYAFRLTVEDSDGSSDSCVVRLRVTGPPDLECPTEPIETPTRRSLRLRVPTRDDVGIASQRWELRVRPDGSSAMLMPPVGPESRLTPDRQGRYLVRYRATDVEGMASTCDIEVYATPTPPSVSCPERLDTSPLEPTRIEASGVDDGEIVAWAWTVRERAAGSASLPPSPDDAPVTTFTPDVAGEYRLEVMAVDDDGQEGSCETVVRAGNVDGIRVQISWSTELNDIDLHLLEPTAMRWFDLALDCYYLNCEAPDVLDWGGPGTDDNPRLDIDDVDGFGPENINVLRPEPGVYRVGAHYFGQNGGPSATDVTVRIFCQDSETIPRRTIGPVRLARPSQDFWRVADIEILRGGDCRVTQLFDERGMPDITTRTIARTER
ncbi:MAG: hypothetical protein ACFCGT_24775 [Sandaracinaceae bacterium]